MASPQSPDVLSEFYRLQNQQTQALLDALGQLVQGQRAMQHDAVAPASPLTQPQHAVAPTFRPFDAALESWPEWSRQFGFHLAAYRILATCDLLFDGTPISDSSWNSALNVSRYVGNLKDDTAAEAEYLVLTTKEVTAFTFNSPSDYVDVRFDNPPITLKLVVMEAFTNYEEDMISATDPSIIDVGVQFSCSDGNTVPFIFRITVEDVNKHAPVFEQSSYNCTLPMPCPPDSDLSSFMVDINVRDIDFSNQAITIHFDEEGEQLFTAETTYKGNRVYAVQLYSKATINLAETANFTVTAVDSGTPALTSDPVTIVVSGYNVN